MLMETKAVKSRKDARNPVNKHAVNNNATTVGRKKVVIERTITFQVSIGGKRINVIEKHVMKKKLTRYYLILVKPNNLMMNQILCRKYDELKTESSSWSMINTNMAIPTVNTNYSDLSLICKIIICWICKWWWWLTNRTNSVVAIPIWISDVIANHIMGVAMACRIIVQEEGRESNQKSIHLRRELRKYKNELKIKDQKMIFGIWARIMENAIWEFIKSKTVNLELQLSLLCLLFFFRSMLLNLQIKDSNYILRNILIKISLYHKRFRDFYSKKFKRSTVTRLPKQLNSTESKK